VDDKTVAIFVCSPVGGNSQIHYFTVNTIIALREKKITPCPLPIGTVQLITVNISSVSDIACSALERDRCKYSGGPSPSNDTSPDMPCRIKYRSEGVLWCSAGKTMMFSLHGLQLVSAPSKNDPFFIIRGHELLFFEYLLRIARRTVQNQWLLCGTSVDLETVYIGNLCDESGRSILKAGVFCMILCWWKPTLRNSYVGG